MGGIKDVYFGMCYGSVSMLYFLSSSLPLSLSISSTFYLPPTLLLPLFLPLPLLSPVRTGVGLHQPGLSSLHKLLRRPQEPWSTHLQSAVLVSGCVEVRGWKSVRVTACVCESMYRTWASGCDCVCMTSDCGCEVRVAVSVPPLPPSPADLSLWL